MASKISGVDSAQVASVGAGRSVQRPQDAVTGGTSSGTAPNDDSQSVQITGTARQLVDLEQQMRDMPAVNETRVAQIRDQIEQGTYQVRPQHIADQLMSLERSLSKVPDPTDPDSDESGNSGK